MRILVLQETDWLERNPILHHRMLEDLSSRGHGVVVIDFEISWSSKAREPRVSRRRVVENVVRWGGRHGVTVIRPAMLRLPLLARVTWLAANMRELRRLQSTWRPDVVLAYGISNAWLAQQWARRLRIPFVYHVMDALHTLAEPSILSRPARLVERAVLSSADCVVPVNDALRGYVIGMGADPERVVTIPMGVDVAAAAEEGDAARDALQLREDHVVLLFMGWLYLFSGLVELARELEARAEELPDVRLLIVGDGDAHRQLEQLAARPGLNGRLLLTGRRPSHEMAGFVAASDLCLLPAHDNATMRYIVPAKVIEYMQAGRPVLATPLAGLRAEFGDLPGLLWVQTPQDLLDRVRDLGKTPGERRRRARELGATVRDAMTRRKTWPEVTDDFEQALRAARPRSHYATAHRYGSP